jgi:hypothetical protein
MRLSQRCAMLSLMVMVVAAACRCPEPKPPAVPPAKIIEVVKPCAVPPPVVTLTAEDIPDPDATGQVTLSQEAVVRLGQSIIAWANYVQLVTTACK